MEKMDFTPKEQEQIRYAIPVPTGMDEGVGCPTTVDELDLKLKSFFYEGDISSVIVEEKENFLHNVNSNPNISRYVEENQNYFDLFFSYLSTREYNEKEIENLISNFSIRKNEIEKNKVELAERRKNNPIATDEEYNAGTYKESLETQVREAVFELQRKGYKPWGSGFDSLSTGTQAIWIKRKGVNLQKLKSSLPKGVLATEVRDSIKIDFFTPPNYTIEDLKQVWDHIVSGIPENENKNNDLTYNGLQGVEFRDKQDRIRVGKNTMLGPNLAYVDGKVIEISYTDFQNRYGKIEEKNSMGYNMYMEGAILDQNENTKSVGGILAEQLNMNPDHPTSGSVDFANMNGLVRPTEILDTESKDEFRRVSFRTPDSEVKKVAVVYDEDHEIPTAIQLAMNATNKYVKPRRPQDEPGYIPTAIDLAMKKTDHYVAENVAKVDEVKNVEVENNPVIKQENLSEQVESGIDHEAVLIKARDEYAREYVAWEYRTRHSTKMFANTLMTLGVTRPAPERLSIKTSALEDALSEYDKAKKNAGMIEGRGDRNVLFNYKLMERLSLDEKMQQYREEREEFDRQHENQMEARKAEEKIEIADRIKKSLDKWTVLSPGQKTYLASAFMAGASVVNVGNNFDGFRVDRAPQGNSERVGEVVQESVDAPKEEEVKNIPIVEEIVPEPLVIEIPSTVEQVPPPETASIPENKETLSEAPTENIVVPNEPETLSDPRTYEGQFEDGKIYITCDVATDPNTIKVLLNDTEIANGIVINGKPELKLKSEFKSGWFMAKNINERAIDYASNLVKDTPSIFTI